MSDELRAAIEQAMEPNDDPNSEQQPQQSQPVEAQTNLDQSAGGGGEDQAATDKNAAAPDAEKGDAAAGKTPEAKEQPPAPADGAPAGENVPGQHRVDRPPASWKKDAKGEWAALPLNIRQEVHRRELEISRALNDAALVKQQAQQFEAVAAPFAARMQSLGVTPVQAFNELLKSDYTLATGTQQQKAVLIDKLLQDYGVDIATLDQVISARLGGAAAQQQQQQPQMPDVQALVQQQIQQAMMPLIQQQQQQQMQVQQQAAMTVEQMSLDPKFPYFDDVREDMADLIELSARRGVALTLEQAYSRAVAANPEIQAAQMTMQQNQQARRAAAAAASVSGAPASGGTGNQMHSSAGNLRDDIEAAFSGGRA